MELLVLTLIQLMLLVTFGLGIIATFNKEKNSYILTAEIAMATAMAQAGASYAGIEWRLTFFNAIMCLAIVVICLVLANKKPAGNEKITAIEAITPEVVLPEARVVVQGPQHWFN